MVNGPGSYKRAVVSWGSRLGKTETDQPSISCPRQNDAAVKRFVAQPREVDLAHMQALRVEAAPTARQLVNAEPGLEVLEGAAQLLLQLIVIIPCTMDVYKSAESMVLGLDIGVSAESTVLGHPQYGLRTKGLVNPQCQDMHSAIPNLARMKTRSQQQRAR